MFLFRYLLFVFVVLKCVYADTVLPNILLISESRSSNNALNTRDKRTKIIFWDQVDETNTTNIVEIVSSYDLVVSEVSTPLLLLLKVSKAKLVYISACTHFVLPAVRASGKHDITACGPKLRIARKLDMVVTLSTETARALVKLGVKAKFYPNWSSHNYDYRDTEVEKLVSRNCDGRGIFVASGSKGGGRSRDMRKTREITKIAKSEGVTSAICTIAPNPGICNSFDICEHCDDIRYIEVLNCMGILVLPLQPLLKRSNIESGRGLRTIISGLEHRVTIITTDTPYTRDYLLDYDCATLLPGSASAQEYWKHIREALRSDNKKLCSLNAYNHSFKAATAIPQLLDMLSLELLSQS